MGKIEHTVLAPIMTTTIRNLTQLDEPFLWEMLYQAVYIIDGQPPITREAINQPELSRYVRGWGRSGDQGTISLVGGQPVGAAWLRLFSRAEPGYGFVDEATPELSIAVLPDHRGQGIGTRLLQNVIELALERYQAISLSVTPENPARRLYTRLGFVMVKEDGNAVTMVKSLR